MQLKSLKENIFNLQNERILFQTQIRNLEEELLAAKDQIHQLHVQQLKVHSKKSSSSLSNSLKEFEDKEEKH